MVKFKQSSKTIFPPPIYHQPLPQIEILILRWSYVIIRELKRLKISKSLRKFPSMTESLYGVGTDSDPLLLFFDLRTDKQLLGKVSFNSRYMLWFNFILGSNLIFFCFKLIIIHYNTQKQKRKKNWIEDKIEPQHTHAGGIQDGNWSLTLYFL